MLSLIVRLLVPKLGTSSMSYAKMGPIWVPFRVLRSRVVFRRVNDRDFERTIVIFKFRVIWNKFSLNINFRCSTFHNSLKNPQKSSIFLDETMKVDGHIAGTARPILLIFGQIGANNVNFSKRYMQAGPRSFCWSPIHDVQICDYGTHLGPIFCSKHATFAYARNGTQMGPIFDLGI